METLKETLEKNHEGKTIAQLIDMLKGLETILTPAGYAEISAAKPEELKNFKKAEILAVVDTFKKAYEASWEKKLASASTDAVKLIFNLIKMEEASFGAQNASDGNFPAELGNIPFAKLISGPMNAAVEAQNAASIATVNFIKEVGFTDDNELRMADFSYTKTGVDENGDPTTEEVALVVPFISILNVPSLRIETLDIDFNVKLNSVYTREVKTELGIDASLGIKYGPVDFKVSASYKRSSATGVKIEKEYTMGVKVVATNGEMPGGLEKILNTLAA